MANIAKFALQVIELNISTGISIQVIPKELEKSVEVHICFKSLAGVGPTALMKAIDGIYKELVNGDT